MFRYIWAWIQALFGYVKVWLQAATEDDHHDSAWLGAAPAMEEDPVTVSLGPIGPPFQQLRSAIASLQGNSGRLKLKGVKAQIQILVQELEWLCIDVKGLPEDAMTRCWMRQVRDVCYDTADYLDELMHFIDNSSGTRRRSIRARTFEGNRLLGSKTFLISRKLTWLFLQKVKKLRRAPLIAKLSALVARVEDADETRQRFKLSPPKSIKHDYAQEAGVSHIMPQIPLQIHIDRLTKLLALDDNEMEKNHKVVTIFGSAGVGKTALARTLYHQHRWRFQHRAFIRVSRDPDMRRLLTDMLSQIKAPPANAFSDVQGLIGSITKHLQGKRYLIIIDDLWTTSTWDIIIRALPDGDYCRIITATQVEDVALACCSYQLKHIYEITPLNDDQSGKSEGCCTTYTSSEGMKEALNLVYNNLPSRLKTCLLYLNMYPEGCTIRKDELVKQWAAEGLIASVQGQDIEDTAGYYFDALVSSGLVQSVDTNHNGEVLSCTLHHMVLDLIRQKSMEENFITIVNYFQTILGLPDKVRRLSVQLGGAKGANNIPENMRISQVRSLLFSGFFQHVPSILDYGLLQVLILQIWSDQDRTFDLTTIGELYRLRYLKIESNMTVKLPGKIRRLWHLGTLQVDATLCVVPSDIVHLEKLLHLCLPSGSILPHGVGRMTSLHTLGYFDLGSNSEDNVRSLSELENLHNLQLTCSTVQPAESLEKNMQHLGSVLLKLSSLRTVTLAPASGSCKGNAPPDYAAVSSMSISCDSFSSVSPAPAHLRRLELSRRCCIFSRLPDWLGELAQLFILKIAVRELWKEDTDILKGLPSLTALSLHVATTSAEMVVFGKGGFSVLTYFKFTCTVPWLKLEAGAMPNIQKLTLAFNSMIEDKQGITIEYLSGIKEISAISKGPSLYSVGAGSAWLKGIRNDPRNPKVKWICSVYVGDECTGHVVTQEAQEYYRIQDKGSGGSEIMDETDGVQDEGSGSQPKKYPSEYVLRKYLLLLATLMVTVTYGVGFNPPGGSWQDSVGGHLAGDPIIRTANNLRYLVFFYCNAIALASSILVIVLLLLSNDLVEKKEQCVRIRLLRVLLMLDLLSLLGAYAAGTCRDTRTAVTALCTAVLMAAGVSVYAVVLKWGDPVSGPADQDEIAVQLQEKERLRKVLMLLATFVLSITYVSGLNSPDGFWDSTWGGHHPGDSHKSRLATFFVCNTIAFMSSLVIIMLLLGMKFHARTTARTRSSEMLACVLAVAMLVGLVGAYTAGSSREGGATACVVAVVAAGLVCLLLRTLTSSSSLHRDRDEDEQSPSFRFHMYGLYIAVPSADNRMVWDTEDMRRFQSARSLLLLLSTVATAITYPAGLNPPGGVWQDNKDGHLAGDPVLLSTDAIRYMIFFYCNSIAFVASLATVSLFVLNTVGMFRVLEPVIMLELFGLVGAYAYGACMDINTSIQVMALGGAVLLYVVIRVVLFMLRQADDSEQELVLFMLRQADDSEQELVVLEKKRKLLYLLATLSTAVSYQAGLNPPAGFWLQADDDNKREAGKPVLLYNNPGRYHAFFYCNSLSFTLSVTTMILMMNHHLYRPALRSGALNLCTVAGLWFLMGAYAAGSTQQLTTSIGIFNLMSAAFLIVVPVSLIFFLTAAVRTTKMSGQDDVKPATAIDDSKGATIEMLYTKQRKKLMLIGILMAGAAYQAGLDPPGGVWQSGAGAGDPVMQDNRKKRYLAFFYANSTSFAASITMLLLLLLHQYQHQQHHRQQVSRLKQWLQIRVLRSVVMLDLFALLVAYTAGSSRDLRSSLSVAALLVIAFPNIQNNFIWWQQSKRRELTASSSLHQNHRQ